MWQNKDSYNGLSVLPYDGGNYVQMPFEECTKYKYDKMLEVLSKIDLTNVSEESDNTELSLKIRLGGTQGHIAEDPF